jgi:hypothetical protein
MKLSNMQYNYNPMAILLNFKSPSMIGTVAPTDSRWRKDQRLYEEGKIDEADIEKTVLEEEQWNRRNKAEMGKIPEYEARYFKKVAHPFVDNKNLDSKEMIPVKYDLIDDEKGYW